MVKRKIKECVIVLSAFTGGNAYADVLGVYAGAGIWQGELSGEVGINNQAATLNELGLDDEQNTYFFVALEHPVPVLPNIRVEINDISASASATISRDVVIDNDTTIPADSATRSNLDLSHIDYTLYWEVLDNYISLDIGLTGRDFDGQAFIEYTCPDTNPLCAGETDTADEDLSGIIPLLYGKVQIDLPFTGWYIGGNAKVLSYDGNSISDIEAKVGYMTDGLGLDIGFDLGFRQMKLEVEDDSDLNADITLDGLFASLIVHF